MNNKIIVIILCIVFLMLIVYLYTYNNKNNNSNNGNDGNNSNDGNDSNNNLNSKEVVEVKTEYFSDIQTSNSNTPAKFQKMISYNGMEFKINYSTYSNKDNTDYYMIIVEDNIKKTEGAVNLNSDGTMSVLLQYGNNPQQLWAFTPKTTGATDYLVNSFDGKYRLCYDGGRLFIVDKTADVATSHLWKLSTDKKNASLVVLDNPLIGGNFVENPVIQENADKLADLYSKVNNMYEFMKTKGLLDMDRDNIFTKPIEIRLTKADNFESTAETNLADKLAEYDMNRNNDDMNYVYENNDDGNTNKNDRSVPVNMLYSCNGCSKW